MPRKKILLVDDSTTILMMEKLVLGNGVYDLVTAKNGLEAVERVVSERPDLVLMDVNMPKMDGFEACREIRTKDAGKVIPIIMVTTRAEAQNVEIGYTSGCSDYITKPIDNLELLSKVKSYLED